MQNLDTTALATGLPQIATSLNHPILESHILITAYMLSMAIFLPLSGWVAERFGPRRVFCCAMALFTMASLGCGMAGDFDFMVFMRVLQGIGGALMVPVARLLLVKVVPKHELMGAIALMGVPSLIGPLIGPVVGGTFATYLSWRWIFFINVPVGILSIFFILRIIPAIHEVSRTKFDFAGFVMASGGLTCLLLGLERLVANRETVVLNTLLLGGGAVLLGAYAFYALRAKAPILNVRLLRYSSFSTSVLGGSLFRIGIGAYPFLMPLMLQTVFGLSAFMAGVLTCLSALGSLGMRFLSLRVIGILGYRTTLVWCGIVASLLFLGYAFLTATSPLLLIAALILIGGLFRSLQFTVLNTIVFAETQTEENSHANTFSQMAQRVSQTMGVTLAAIVLQAYSGGTGADAEGFKMAFLAVGACMLCATPFFYRLDPLSTREIEIAARRKDEAGPPALG